MFDNQGNLLHVKDMPEHVRAAIASVEFEKLFEGKGKNKEYVGDVIKIRFWNKVDSLDKLCKIQGMFTAEKFDLTIKHVQVKELAGLSKQELLKLAEMESVNERQN
jgi:hypothetical protein